MPIYYSLDKEGEPIPEEDFKVLADLFLDDRRIVKHEKFGKVLVSTIFLVFNHNFRDIGEPILWETMVFGGKFKEEQNRCGGNRENALAMHEEMVERVIKFPRMWRMLNKMIKLLRK